MSQPYAILGATGNGGQSVLNVLADAQKPIHALVRSRAKLHNLNPDICDRDNIKIYEGSIDNINVLRDCIRGTKAVFLCVASANNVPGCSIAQTTANSVLAALRLIKHEDRDARLPRLVVLSSASTSDYLCRNMSHIAHRLVYTGFSQVYSDLSKAEAILRENSDTVSSTFVKPGAMVHDDAHGHMLSTELQQSFLSWKDLAAGMVEVADAEGDAWDTKEVSVQSRSPARFGWDAPVNVFYGILCHFFPGLYSVWSSLPGF